MKSSPPPRRTPVRRRSAARSAALLASLVVTAGACAGGSSGPTPSASNLPPVVLATGETVYPFREREAQGMLERSREALLDGRAREAADLARRIVEEYATTAASGPGLLALARAELALENQEAARRHINRYANVLPPGDPRSAEVSLFRAEELLAYGRPVEGVRAILALPLALPIETREWALTRVRRATDALDSASVAELLRSTPPDHPLATPLLVSRARTLDAAGERAEAETLARSALEAGASGPERSAATALLRGYAAADAEAQAEARAEEEARARRAAQAEEERRREAARAEAERLRAEEAARERAEAEAREREEEARRRRQAEAEEAAREEEARRRREAEAEAPVQPPAEVPAEPPAAAPEPAPETVPEARPETPVDARVDEAARARRSRAIDAGQLPPLVVEPAETMYPFRERQAENLLVEGWDAFGEGRWDEAVAAADRILRDHPSTMASGPALRLRAEALRSAGREAEAREAMARYETLLEGTDPRRADVRLFRAEGILLEGEIVTALDSVLRLPSGLLEETRARALGIVRGVVTNLDRQALGTVMDRTPLGQPLAAPLMVAYGQALRADGEGRRAARFAEAALAVGAEGPDEIDARTLLALAPDRPGETQPAAAPARPEGDAPVTAGRTDPTDPTDPSPTPADGPTPDAAEPAGAFALETTVTVGALLPTGGSPAMARFAALVEEGIVVALEGPDAPEGITVAVTDDGGGPAGAAGAVAAATASGALGIVGPLEDAAVIAAADARTGPLPIISPTALNTRGREGVYTLGGPDPGAAHALARYAVESGLDQVVVLHPDTEEHAYEAALFRTTMLELGGSVLRVLTYPEGTTTFGELLQTARFLEPEALVLPAPARDIQALAPQISFFGLDTLGIRVLGTDEWTDAEVLRNVSARHTNGVVIATAREPGGDRPGYRRFEQAYQTHFQRSLRDPVPALGYDAASLFLEALRLGARTPEEMRDALERIDGFPGATGVLSVENGRIVREHHLACIQDGRIIPVPPGTPPTPYRPERRGDYRRGEPERVPLGPLQVYCPGEPVPDTAHIMRRPGRPVPTPAPAPAPTPAAVRDAPSTGAGTPDEPASASADDPVGKAGEPVPVPSRAPATDPAAEAGEAARGEKGADTASPDTVTHDTPTHDTPHRRELHPTWR